MNPWTRSLATRLIDAIELYVNTSRAPSEQLVPLSTLRPHSSVWQHAVDGRRDLGESAADHEIPDRATAI
jgi:hypothetical protein